MSEQPVKVRIYLTGGQVVETHAHELSEDDEMAREQIRRKLVEGRWQELGSVHFHSQSVSAIEIA